VQRLKEKLEVKKLEVEIAQLKEKNFEWLTGLLGLLAGVAGSFTTLLLPGPGSSRKETRILPTTR
jgi:hypothetical protein